MGSISSHSPKDGATTTKKATIDIRTDSVSPPNSPSAKSLPEMNHTVSSNDSEMVMTEIVK
eukprot:CAMPEP_0201572110 /NCGR_PEP_ID=MMETSP0190_2-20130828/15186_1 /ASSEMBLY_ACC=CAM_ASM_000263 /TAXON_ID=37353 /ORGANISM="Rosalina sp." /LENGTH=60 /DNA_ID=CAMNT_0047997451 /DNA_START=363 /DNA_END=545 /DNA_ORIENTATION=-